MNQAGSRSSVVNTTSKGQFPVSIAVCIALILLGASPIAFSWPPEPTAVFFREFPGWQTAGFFSLHIVIAGIVLLMGRLDPEPGTGKIVRYCGFVLLAALLTDLHYFTVDISTSKMHWQFERYNNILLHRDQPPDQYRFLPQGVLWWIILCNGDFDYSYFVYRLFFTFLVCQAIYGFARSYLAPRDAIIVVLFYAAFYPLSTRYYNGNLLDPMSHAAILVALTFCQRRQFGQFFWMFVLGMFIKETMLLTIPCYYLMNCDTFRPRDLRVVWHLALLAVAGIVVFLACRIPFHFHCDFQSLNRTHGLMISSNLGLRGAWVQGLVSVFQLYLHPILFIFMWLPLIVLRRKLLPRPLFWTALYLAAAFYLVNLCFGWNYESRNFVPVLIFLLVCTLIIVNHLIEKRPSAAVMMES